MTASDHLVTAGQPLLHPEPPVLTTAGVGRVVAMKPGGTELRGGPGHPLAFGCGTGGIPVLLPWGCHGF